MNEEEREERRTASPSVEVAKEEECMNWTTSKKASFSRRARKFPVLNSIESFELEENFYIRIIHLIFEELYLCFFSLRATFDF